MDGWTRGCLEAYWSKWEDKLIDVINRNNGSNRDNTDFKNVIHNLISKEHPTKPLVIGNEIECRNCKKIMFNKNQLRKYVIDENKRCCNCGQVIDWSDIIKEVKNEQVPTSIH